MDEQTSEPVSVSLTKEELEMTPEERRVAWHEDGIQHGLDDNPKADPAKGAVLGAIGGAVVGALAGAIAGPAGMVTGALVGAGAGGAASGLAVAAVDAVDNDDNVTGIGAEAAIDEDELLPERLEQRLREEERLKSRDTGANTIT